MSTAFVLATGILIFALRQSKSQLGNARALKKEAHKYSGIGPDDFKTFLSQLRRCELLAHDDPRRAATHLYYAIDALQSLALFNNYQVSDEIDALCEKIGYEYEIMLFEHSLKKRIVFQGRYLNKRIHS